MKQLEEYKKELEQELENILSYWMRYAVDELNGGFFGQIDHENKVTVDAPKGSVLNSRILWSFSAAYNHTKNEAYLKTADRAYHYILDHFIDHDFGGVYWTVDFTGKPLDTKKQVYALSFALYAFSEYFRCRQDNDVRKSALKMYRLIVSKSFDQAKGGYLEAFTRNWQTIDDLRLSEKDANEKKTMNTHLHVLEAFTNLYRWWKDEELKQRIIALINNFLDHIIDRQTCHLNLFFDEDWILKPGMVSYGHDIEAAWLLQEAAEVIDDEPMLEHVKQQGVRMAIAASEGIDKDGGLWYEYDPLKSHHVKERHWWVQAEAMVGYFNAWQVTGSEKFLWYSQNSWKFIQSYILDKTNGEWRWGIREDHQPMEPEDKVGIWKCPYHNGRACLEIIRRIKES